MIDLDPDRVPVTPRDAATVILLREEDQGFSLFMVRRHDRSGFMAGAYVFPGGTLDEADMAEPLLERAAGRSRAEAAVRLGEDDPTLAMGLHVAALRETFEEAGVLLARGADALDLADARARLNAGDDFFRIMEELDLSLRIDALAPWSRWVTPTAERRRYDARFFVARAPRDQQAAHDAIEVTAGEWLSPAAALDRFVRKEISLPPPTLRTVEQLEASSSIDHVFERAASRVPRVVLPELVQVADTLALVLPGDPEHSQPERAIDGATRFVLTDGQFRSAEPLR